MVEISNINSSLAIIAISQLLLILSTLYFFKSKNKLDQDIIKIKSILSSISIEKLNLTNQNFHSKNISKLYSLCRTIIEALSETRLSLEHRHEVIEASTKLTSKSSSTVSTVERSLLFIEEKISDKLVCSAFIEEENGISKTLFSNKQAAKRLKNAVHLQYKNIKITPNNDGYYEPQKNGIDDLSLFGIKRSYYLRIKNSGDSDSLLWLGLATEVEFLNKKELFLIKTIAQQIHSFLSCNNNSNTEQNIDNLLLGISHDLKAPNSSSLSIVRGFLSGDFGKVSAEQFLLLKLLESSLEEQQGLVADILDYASSKQGKLDIKQENLRLVEIITDILKREQFNAKQKKIYLTCDEIPEIEIKFDRRHAKRIVSNLVSNAIKYTNSGGVHISFKEVKNHLVLRIIDTGIGIPKEDTNSIFQSFTRCKNSDRYSGTGLGLSIAKFLAETNGGYIKYCANPKGGSIFEFALNLASKIYFDKILLLEDDQATLRSYTRYLKEFCTEVRAFTDATSAIKEVHQLKPDLVISDICLNDKTSLPFIRIMPDNMPLIVISGNNNLNKKVSQLKSENIFFLEKPLNRTRLNEIFETLKSNQPLNEAASNI